MTKTILKKPAAWKKKLEKREKNQIVYAYVSQKAATYLQKDLKKFDQTKSEFLNNLLLAYHRGEVYKPTLPKSA